MTKTDVIVLVGMFAGGALVLAVLLVIALVRDLVAHRRRRLDEWSGDAERATSEIGILRPEPDVLVTPSPLIGRPYSVDTASVQRPAPSVQRAAAEYGHHARLDQQARHANVITAAGPFTREFNARVEWETGKPPAGRGPREADVRMRRTERQPGEAWAQLDLFAEVG